MQNTGREPALPESHNLTGDEPELSSSGKCWCCKEKFIYTFPNRICFNNVLMFNVCHACYAHIKSLDFDSDQVARLLHFSNANDLILRAQIQLEKGDPIEVIYYGG